MLRILTVERDEQFRHIFDRHHATVIESRTSWFRAVTATVVLLPDEGTHRGTPVNVNEKRKSIFIEITETVEQNFKNIINYIDTRCYSSAFRKTYEPRSVNQYKEIKDFRKTSEWRCPDTFIFSSQTKYCEENFRVTCKYLFLRKRAASSRLKRKFGQLIIIKFFFFAEFQEFLQWIKSDTNVHSFKL